MRAANVFASLSAVLLLAGCDQEVTLHSGLEERQANLVDRKSVV